MSALRRMRATDTPIAFKPWIYEIAKNACIDAFRRSRRAEEVSYDADEGGTEPAPRQRRADARRGARRARSRSTTCAARSAASRRPITRSSSCASSRASPTARSARSSA